MPRPFSRIALYLSFLIRISLAFLWVALVSLGGLVVSVFCFQDVRFNYYLGRAFAFGLIRSSRMRLKVEGLEHLPGGPKIFVGNHQHLLDFQVYGSFFPRKTVIVGKRELIWFPFFGFIFYAAGNVLIHRQDRNRALSSLEQIGEAITKRGVSVFMFPEGTRNRSMQGLLPFKKGAFHLAIQTQTSIVPIVLSSMKAMFDAETGIQYGGEIRVRILKPISVTDYGREDVARLTTKVRTLMLDTLAELEAR